jgi:hypothetical protein
MLYLANNNKNIDPIWLEKYKKVIIMKIIRNQWTF